MKPQPGSKLHSENRFGQPAATNKEAIEPIGQFYEGCFKCAAQMNSEAASFIQHRIEEDVQLTRKLSQCQSPTDVYNTQVLFCMHMMDDYIQEGQKMLEMARSITMNGDMTNGGSESSSNRANGSE